MCRGVIALEMRLAGGDNLNIGPFCRSTLAIFADCAAGDTPVSCRIGVLCQAALGRGDAIG
jgi:hypothetical protein